MSNELTTQDYINNAVQQYVPVVVGDKPVAPEDHIKSIADYCNTLTIAGLNDKKGYDLVKAALNKVKKLRTAVEGKRKELKAVALEYGKAVDGEAKRLTLLVQPIEDALAKKIAAIDEAAEQARKAEQIRRNQLMLDSGFMFYAGVYTAGIYCYSTDQVMQADEATLAVMVQNGIDERDRIAAEKARMEAERAELERLRAEQAAEAKKLADERAALEAERIAKGEKDIAQRAAEIVAAAQIIEPVKTVEAAVPFAKPPVHDVADAIAVANSRLAQAGLNITGDYKTANKERIELAYTQGFDKAKALILEKLNDPTPISRADLKAFVNGLKPNFK